MKKILNILIVILFAFLISSCNGTNTPDNNKISYDGVIEFGMYPKTKIVDTQVIQELDAITTTNERGFIEYNEEYYFKNEDYYKVEPITWEVVTKNKVHYLYTTEVIDYCVFNSDEYFEVNINAYLTKPGVPEKTPANIYQYSDLRTWLNSTFLNRAFSDDEQNNIIKYEYDGFSDLVYTLCEDDFEISIQRALKPTDYAKKACDVHISNDINDKFNGYTLYWLRNANSFVPYQVYGMNYDGIVYEFVNCYYAHIGVRPVIKLSEIPVDIVENN